MTDMEISIGRLVSDEVGFYTYLASVAFGESAALQVNSLLFAVANTPRKRNGEPFSLDELADIVKRFYQMRQDMKEGKDRHANQG